MLLPLLAVLAVSPAAGDGPRLRAEAAQASIVRDDWGIAHVHGKTDAEAVFAMAYAQAEDDFNRVETNYATALGRSAEAADAKPDAIWADLRQRLYVDPDDLKARYAASPAWLKAVMNGWADGLNYFLFTHPHVRPKVLARFEPWMALSFTEGSIGGDIEKIDLKKLQAFYDRPAASSAAAPITSASVDGLAYREPTGSNGVAIAPKNTKGGHALLLINPHTSFYFRSELQVSSDEGLNVYGAATWGQPFIYQGFNPHVGFMHTTSGADSVDEFAETPVLMRSGPMGYRYGGETRRMTERRVTLRFREASGAMGERSFTVLATHHGPVVRRGDDGKPVSVAMMYRPVEALSQSFLRTKAADYADFVSINDRFRADSSNNTLFADDQGEIAYLHPQFIPMRSDLYDYRLPVDGSDPATDWKGDTPFDGRPHLLNPRSGFLYNSNDQPWSAAGAGSLKEKAFPRYMDQFGWNPRSDHALRVLTGKHDFTLQGLRDAAYDSYLPEFAKLIPQLESACDQATDSRDCDRLREPLERLRRWDFRWGADSVATSVAVFYGEKLWADAAPKAKAAGLSPYVWMETRSTPSERIAAFAAAIWKLKADFGTWDTPWGQINRYQRLDDAITPHFDDAKPSIPLPFTSAQWGSLASFGLVNSPGAKKRYGNSGNSFVAVVEFGPRVKAIAVTAGGESGDPKSPHFTDQASRYAAGALRPVYFWPDELQGHTVRSYRPGQ